MLWFSFAWDCGLLDNNLIIPQYLLEIKELKMNDKAVIALVMAYGDHGCQLSNVEYLPSLFLMVLKNSVLLYIIYIVAILY